MKSKDIKSMFLRETESIDISMAEKVKNTPVPPAEIPVTTKTAKPKRNFFAILKPYYALALCLVLIIGGVFIFRQPTTVANAQLTAYVLEINPSFCITADKDDVIINVCSLNDDADTVLSNEEFDTIVGKTLEEGVDKIIKVVSQNGFLNGYQNVIQIYAVNDDKNTIPAKLDKFGQMLNGDLQKYGHGDVPFDKHELPLDDFKTRMGFESNFIRLDDMKEDIRQHGRFIGERPTDNPPDDIPPEHPTDNPPPAQPPQPK